MGFIGDEKEIKEKTKGEGYGVGELYVYETLKCARRNDKGKEGKAKIFDTDSYNFHLYPEDGAIASQIAEEIREKRLAVIKEFEKMEESKITTLQTIAKFNAENKIHGKIYISGKSDGKGGDGQKGGNEPEFNQLYRYIVAEKNNVLYELNFMRFFIDRENKVNCILKAIQFDRCMGEFVNKSIEGCCDICYPKTSEAQSEEDLKYILKNRKGESFCYNPPISFYDTADNIAETFIRFINDCDKWSHANNE